MRFFFRTVMAGARVSSVMYWRVFSWVGFALRFFPPLLNLGAAWILYNIIFQQSPSASFIAAANSSDYFGFVVIGSAFFVYVVATMFTLGRVMYWDRSQGTLEAIFLTPISSFAYMAGRMLSAFSLATVDLLFLFGLGYLLGFRPTGFTVMIFLVAAVLMMVSLFGLGLIVNSVTLIFRDRVNTANTLTTLVLVFSGIVAPLQLMPSWAQAIGSTIPFTYILNLMRASLLSKGPVLNLSDLSALALLGPVYLLAGYLLLHATVKAVRKRALYAAL